MRGPFVLAGLLGLLGTVASAQVAVGPASAGRPLDPLPPAAPLHLIEEPAPRRVPPPPPPPAPSPVADDGRLRLGSRGEAVLAMEARLEALSYMVGAVDGAFDQATRHGLIAFQKVEGLPRSGTADRATLDRLEAASVPTPAYATPGDHLEVDIPRQVVLVVRGGRVTATLPASTGSNKLFTAQGWTRRAVTPNGQFRVTRKINGMRISPLGKLYKPSYFNGGIALHGNPSVPTYPASHGCVRLPMQFADWFFVHAAPVGMVVYVYGGPNGPNPQPFVDDRPAPGAPQAEPVAEPSPSPSEAPAPSPSPSPSRSEAPAPSPSPSPSPAPAPSPSPSPEPSESPTPSPGVSPSPSPTGT